ncbi:MAG: ABC transporter substrate-binding protein [Deltaproteobacteria bacterium]|nr:MAG: ABC transporter substrate-binding protein [Deltaproteobacteria bacterium]
MNARSLIAVLVATLVAIGVGLSALPDGPRDEPGHGLVSLHPSITDTLVAIGATDQLVGRSDYCGNPAVAEVPAVGTSLTPNLEAIVGLHPARILVEGSAGARVDQLAKLGAHEVLPWLTLDETATSIRRLGELSGHEAEAETLAKRFETRLGTPAPADAPRVLLVLSLENGGPVWFLKRNSLHGSALEAAGYANAVAEDVEGPPTLSLERLLELDPDAIVLLVPESADDAVIAEAKSGFEALDPLTAPGRGQLHTLAGAWLGTGPEILDFADALEALPITAK